MASLSRDSSPASPVADPGSPSCTLAAAAHTPAPPPEWATPACTRAATFCAEVHCTLMPLLACPPGRAPPVRRPRRRRSLISNPRRSVHLAKGVGKGSTVTKQQRVVIRRLCLANECEEIMDEDLIMYDEVFKRHCLGNRFDNFEYLPALGTRGGILIAWDGTMVAASNPHQTANTLTMFVKPMAGGQWWLTGVYGPEGNEDRFKFMPELIDIGDLHAGPWAIAGDFNLLVNPEDKSNDIVNHRMMARFRAKINMMELRELYLNERMSTWSNERQNPTLDKIDHVFV
ncbi:Serine/threonine-protein kinase SMG1 [Hordeum vulgare]|nr:Serine/threonine-protein kinase SMG1 [Hordeum vulgare]